MFYVINTDLNLRCGGSFKTFKEAVQYRARLLAEFPDMRLAIK